LPKRRFTARNTSPSAAAPASQTVFAIRAQSVFSTVGAVTVAVVTFCTRFGGAASFMLCAGMPTVPAFVGASFRSPTMSCL